MIDDDNNKELFIQKNQKYYFDLPRYCINKIKNCGVREIGYIKKCTYENSNEFFLLEDLFIKRKWITEDRQMQSLLTNKYTL